MIADYPDFIKTLDEQRHGRYPGKGYRVPNPTQSGEENFMMSRLWRMNTKTEDPVKDLS
jgi:hypothetical protein